MIFIKKGDRRMTAAQATSRGLSFYYGEFALFEQDAFRLKNEPAYKAWQSMWYDDNIVNEANNLFNGQLAHRDAARARLAQYVLAVGRPEIVENLPTGEFDPDTGEAITVATVTLPAIMPLPALVDVTTYDDATGEATTVQGPNPVITEDYAERDAAQAVLDALPAEVLDYA